MKLGVAYNLFDSEELLEYSILSLKKCVDFICVVYQTVSNYGEPAHPNLEKMLEDLQKRALIDVLFKYEPTKFNMEERKILSHADVIKIGYKLETVCDQYYNEMVKREIGRLICIKNNCDYFMSCDADEFYDYDQLIAIKKVMYITPNITSSACLMEHYFKYPTCKMMPENDEQYVPVICKLDINCPFRLMAPYPVTVDPTRRILYDSNNVFITKRPILTMYHFSLVRKDMRIKLYNASNRGSHTNVDKFHSFFTRWKIGEPLKQFTYTRDFTKIEMVENKFNIHLDKSCEKCFKKDATFIDGKYICDICSGKNINNKDNVLVQQ